MKKEFFSFHRTAKLARGNTSLFKENWYLPCTVYFFFLPSMIIKENKTKQTQTKNKIYTAFLLHLLNISLILLSTNTHVRISNAKKVCASGQCRISGGYGLIGKILSELSANYFYS